MNPAKVARLRRRVARFCLQFAQRLDAVLSSALPAEVVEDVEQQAYPNGWRERAYGPLTTLKLFIEAVEKRQKYQPPHLAPAPRLHQHRVIEHMMAPTAWRATNPSTPAHVFWL